MQDARFIVPCLDLGRANAGPYWIYDAKYIESRLTEARRCMSRPVRIKTANVTYVSPVNGGLGLAREI